MLFSNKEAVRTFAGWFLGAVIYEAYKQFVVIAPMEKLNKEQKIALDAQTKIISEMRQKMEKHNIV
jgi:hypothetical protein